MDHEIPESLRELYHHGQAKATKIGYASDLLVFEAWCRAHQKVMVPCSPRTLIEFMLDQSEAYAYSTVSRRLSAVSWAHRSAGYLGPDNPRSHPSVSEALTLLRRKRVEEGRMETKEAAPLTTNLVRELMLVCKTDEIENRGLRDRALILIGFAAALRRSELIALEIKDLEFVIEGVELLVRKSKTDQQGSGHTRRVARGDIPVTCPVTALRDWLNGAGITEGGIFRRVLKGGQIGTRIKSGEAVRGIVKRRLKQIGRQDWDAFSGHSFRKGFASVAAERGSGIAAIQAQGNWKSTRAMLGYIKNREGWETAASKNLGL